MKRFMLGAAAAAMVLHAPAAAAETREEAAARKEEEKKLGSLYVRCDGQPNNITGGETFARLVGAVTLLGIFAPSPEAPDPSKRLFAEKGVDACSQLIDGEKAEGNGLRRIPLILARALHQIEAKNYQAAIDDVAKAKGEATALGLVGNPYFDRSMGLSFKNIEATALLRLGDVAGAQAASLSRLDTMKYSFVPLVFIRDYSEFIREVTPRANELLSLEATLLSGGLPSHAIRLEAAGRFAEAALKREANIDLNESLKPKNASSRIYAEAALAHALAGDWSRAEQRATFARNNLQQRRTAGVPDTDPSAVVELLDLFDILRTAHDGDMAKARRTFAARSEWLAASFGVVLETTRRLREGAAAEEQFGALARSADELWTDYRDKLMAEELQTDSNNRTLFIELVPYAKIDEFEARSKDTWNTKKFNMMLKEPTEQAGLWAIYATGPVQTRFDSIVLHAALRAKERNKQGFTVLIHTGDSGVTMGLTRFVDRSELGEHDASFLDADAVIAELSQVIPSPETLKARRNARPKTATTAGS